jgi:enolase
LLHEKEVNLFKKTDDALKNFKEREEEDGNVKIGSNITVAVSNAIYIAQAKALNMQASFLEMFKYNVCRDFRAEDRIPKLTLTVLSGGKDSGSKVKFSKFYVIFDMKPEDVENVDAEEVYYNLSSAIEKAISSTKQGLGGFKRQADGCYFNAFDNINECFKLLEDAIESTGVNTPDNKILRIGVNAEAHAWYQTDQKAYDWDGPKNLMTCEQLIEFYEKIC